MKVVEPNRRVLQVIALVLIGMSLLFVLLTRSHRWRQQTNVTVFYNGVVLEDSSVYRSSAGEVLVRLDGIRGERWYIVSPIAQDVGTTDKQQFWFIPGYAFSKDVVPPIISLRSIKAEMEPRLMVNGDAIEFMSLGGVKVQVVPK